MFRLNRRQAAVVFMLFLIAGTLTFAFRPAQANTNFLEQVYLQDLHFSELAQKNPTELAQGFPDWINTESIIAFSKLVANISPSDVATGEVMASPQRQNPNYYYHWVRDAALTMDVVVRNYILSDSSAREQWLKPITNYIDFSRTNQLSATALTGLGEPKFNPDGSPYMGDWGRPQNDGPALRALTAIRFARELISEGQLDYVQAKLYDSRLPTNSLIKADLEYVSRHWSDLSFDLWEEVKGDHFYTRIVQAAALTQGAALARTLNDAGAASFYESQAEAVMNSLSSFWDPHLGLIRVTLNRTKGGEAKQGLDSAIILGVLHAGFKQGLFTVADSRVMATALKLETGFGAIYSVNDPMRFPNFGPAIGRYPEDIYSGTANLLQGNPWVLSTAALAQYYYELATMLNQVSQFTVDTTNSAFLSHLGLQGLYVQPGFAFTHGSAEMGQLVQILMARGDLFLERIRLHENIDGSLSEQIDRNSGYMSSARDLTWSYASFITAQWARQSF